MKICIQTITNLLSKERAMKTFKVALLFFWFIGISVWGPGGDASGAIFVTVTPSSGPADAPFTIQTTAAAPEGRVLLELIYDFDNSGNQNGLQSVILAKNLCHLLVPFPSLSPIRHFSKVE